MAVVVLGDCNQEDSREFSGFVAELAELYGNHIGIEECEGFPVAATLLEKLDRESMGGEMAARRGVRMAHN